MSKLTTACPVPTFTVAVWTVRDASLHDIGLAPIAEGYLQRSKDGYLLANELKLEERGDPRQGQSRARIQ